MFGNKVGVSIDTTSTFYLDGWILNSFLYDTTNVKVTHLYE